MRQGCDYLLKRRSVTKGFTDVSEVVQVPRAEHERPAELERIFTQCVLAMAGSFRPFARGCIVAAQKMEDVRLLQAEDTVSLAFLVDEQREINAGVFAEGARVFHAAQSDSDKASAPGRDL